MIYPMTETQIQEIEARRLAWKDHYPEEVADEMVAAVDALLVAVRAWRQEAQNSNGIQHALAQEVLRLRAASDTSQ